MQSLRGISKTSVMVTSSMAPPLPQPHSVASCRSSGTPSCSTPSLLAPFSPCVAAAAHRVVQQHHQRRRRGAACITRAAVVDEDAAEAPLRTMVASSFAVAQSRNGKAGPFSEFFGKLQLCFHIFFPEKPKMLSPKEEVKRRLKMVLVADRCGMSPGSISDLKKTIAKALQDFVDIDSEEAIEVNISTDPGLGTVYCVAIPVRRVKPEARFAGEMAMAAASATGAGSSAEGVTMEWDPSDWNSDPSARFPMGC